MKKLKNLRLALLTLTIICAEAKAQFEIVEPEPFRREEMDDRSFKYSDQSFIDRFSYRFRPEVFREWERQREGFRISSGSVSSREMYTVIQFHQEWFMEDWISGLLRHRRDEDFDSRYDRTLVGFGLHPDQYNAFRVLADVVAEKQNIDLHLEYEWQQNPRIKVNKKNEQVSPFTDNDRDLKSVDVGGQRSNEIGSRIRFVTIFTDHFYNNKSSQGSYDEKPLTFFGEGVALVNTNSFFHGWINYNPKVQLNINEDQSTFAYKQATGGIRFDIGLTDQLRFLTRVRRENGSRDRFGAPDLTYMKNLNRSSTIFETQFDYQINGSTGVWIGSRSFTFDEDDVRQNDPNKTIDISREEIMVHGGIIYAFTNSWRLAPGIYINQLNNHENFKFSPESNKKNDTLGGKITLPLEHDFSRYKGRLTFAPTFEFPGNAFGGLNVQVQFLL